jgi:hypothetical protein
MNFVSPERLAWLWVGLPIVVFSSDLAPLAPLRGEGLGERGFERVSLHCIVRCALARCAPSSPALLPRKAGGEGSQSLGFLWLHRCLPNLHALQNLPAQRTCETG